MINVSRLRRILSSAGLKKRASFGTVRKFRKEDWWGWASAESFSDGSDPVIGEFDEVSIPKQGIEHAIGTVIADNFGITIDFEVDDDSATFFSKGNVDPDEAFDVVTDVMNTLKKGRIPPGFMRS